MSGDLDLTKMVKSDRDGVFHSLFFRLLDSHHETYVMILFLDKILMKQYLFHLLKRG